MQDVVNAEQVPGSAADLHGPPHHFGIRIRIRVKARIRIRSKVKTRIRIRIKVKKWKPCRVILEHWGSKSVKK